MKRVLIVAAVAVCAVSMAGPVQANGNQHSQHSQKHSQHRSGQSRHVTVHRISRKLAQLRGRRFSSMRAWMRRFAKDVVSAMLASLRWKPG